MDRPEPPPARVPLRVVAREWTRIGVTGFGGPPAHIALLQRLVVERRGWISAHAFQDAVAVCNLLPGPASTQLAILSAHTVAGRAGAIVGGLGFVVPSVLAVLVLSVLFLGESPPRVVAGAGAGAGAAVAAVAVEAARGLLGPSLARVGAARARRARWVAYLLAGVAAAALLGPWLVLVLLACGLAEVALRTGSRGAGAALQAAPLLAAATTGGLAALAWTALKVGALSYGGGFVIIPLMQEDAVDVHGWMTEGEFLSAVALGQVTPGPVVSTVAAVGFAAHGVGGALLAAAVAFLPSFAFVVLGAGHFERLRRDARVNAFLDGAGPAAVGAILGAAVTLAAALTEPWQAGVLAVAAVALFAVRLGVVPTLLGAGAIGAVAALAGAPLP
jgi:chromate transporter